MRRTWEIAGASSEVVGGAGEPVRSVALTLVAGRVDVVAQPGTDSARYEVHDVTGLPLVASWDDGQLRLEHHKELQGHLLDVVKGFLTSTRPLSATITLTVPAGARVTVNTVNASVFVAGVEGDVSINTVSGATSLSRLAGRVDVKTVSSGIEASGLRGELKSKTVSGRLTVDDSPLRSAKIATVSGAVLLDLSGASCLVTANGVSGDVTVRLPSGSGFDVTGASTSGHVVVDGHTLSGGSTGEKGGHRSEGDRTFAIKARTVSGNVVVLRDTPLGAWPEAPGAGTRPLRDGDGDDAGTHDADGVQDVRPSDRRNGTGNSGTSVDPEGGV